MFYYSNKFWLPSKPQIICNNTLITYKPEVRFFVICITENLKWNFCIRSLCSSLSKVSYEVTKGSFEPIHANKHLFCIIRMAFEIWYNTLGRGKWKLKTVRVQKRVIPIISGANKCKSCRPIFKDYKIITVTTLYSLEVLCYIKRSKGNLKHKITIHSHNTRSELTFHGQIFNTVLFQKSMVNMGIKLHNKVPDSTSLHFTSLFTFSQFTEGPTWDHRI